MQFVYIHFIFVHLILYVLHYLFLGQEGIGDGAGLRVPETIHFLPHNCGHFFTRIIPRGVSEESTGMLFNSSQ